MLTLARVLAAPPKLLIADEMSLGLAPLMVDLVFESLGQGPRARASPCCSSSSSSNGRSGFADEAVILRHGLVGWQGTPTSAGGRAPRRVPRWRVRLLALSKFAHRTSVCEHTFVSEEPEARARSGEATILHADLDAFYASVEQRDDPRLRGRPVIVGGGVVLVRELRGARRSACAPRWADGRPGGSAPGRSWSTPRMSAYSEASKAVFEVFDDTTPLVEGLSIDEAFLDVGWPAAGLGDARPRSRRGSGTNVLERVGLPITVGVARTKFLAKVASGVAKPDGLLVVPPDRRARLPASARGRATVGRRPDHRARSSTRGASRRSATWPASPKPSLVSMLGRASGRHLHALAHNRDPRPVVVGRRRGSIGSQHALGRARVDDRPTRSTRSSSGSSTASPGRMRRARPRRPHRRAAPALRRLHARRRARTRCRTPTAQTRHDPRDRAGPDGDRDADDRANGASRSSASRSATSTTTDAVQLALPFDRHSGRLRSTLALDDVRARFGADAVGRAVLMGHDQHFSVPLLPDPGPGAQRVR